MPPLTRRVLTAVLLIGIVWAPVALGSWYWADASGNFGGVAGYDYRNSGCYNGTGSLADNASTGTTKLLEERNCSGQLLYEYKYGSDRFFTWAHQNYYGKKQCQNSTPSAVNIRCGWA